VKEEVYKREERELWGSKLKDNRKTKWVINKK